LLSIKSRCTLVGTRATGSHSSESVCLNCHPVSSICTADITAIGVVELVSAVTGLHAHSERRSTLQRGSEARNEVEIRKKRSLSHVMLSAEGTDMLNHIGRHSAPATEERMRLNVDAPPLQPVRFRHAEDDFISVSSFGREWIVDGPFLKR